MGISRNKEVYTQKMIQGVAKIIPLTFTATVDFWTRDSEVRKWDPATNKYSVTYTSTNPEPIKARIQPMRSAVQRYTAVNGTWTAHVLFSMAYDDRFSITAGSRAKVLTVSNNPALRGKFYTVKEIMDSDNSYEFTILCEVDTEYVEEV